MKQSFPLLNVLLALCMLTACGDEFMDVDASQEEGVFSPLEAGKADAFTEKARTQTIDRLLSLDAGEHSRWDLTDGSVIVAGPVYGVTAVLACTRGTLYVAAGTVTGVLATTFAAAGVATGPGVTVTASASVPIFAAAGGLIGLAASSGSWSTCADGLARLGVALFQEGGYDSAVRGLQRLFGYSPPATTSRAPARTQPVQAVSSGRTCSDSTFRQLNARKNGLCKAHERPHSCHDQSLYGWGGTNCAEIQRRITHGSRCVDARRELNNACFGGQGHADANGRRTTEDLPLEKALDAVRYCIDRFNAMCR